MPRSPRRSPPPLPLPTAADPPVPWRCYGPLAVAALGGLAMLATIAPETSGPGVTCDELYHVASGKRLVMCLRQNGLSFFTRRCVDRAFPFEPGGPPVHPPLGSWILGAVHHVFDPAPDVWPAVSVPAARFAPALAFVGLVALVGLATARLLGAAAGTVAAWSTAVVPRVFAHGHLAALDTFTSLALVAAILGVIWAESRTGWRPWLVAGLLWGLALLTRFHGLLLGPPVALWLFWRRGRRALPALAGWGMTGLATFLAGWPWLWYSTWDRAWQFLRSATQRPSIHVFYAGRAWSDVDAPWHYPFVMFTVTLPLGLLLLGLAGIWANRGAWRGRPALALIVVTLAWMLSVFAIPGVPVYDGVRLFLGVFPLWAVLVGAGAAWLLERSALRGPRTCRLTATALAVLLLLQGYGLVQYHPFQLSHYNMLVGGLAGAERLGLEVTYWGDAVREPMLAEVAERVPGQPVLLVPNLAEFQARAVRVTSPSLTESEVELLGWDPARPERLLQCRLAVVYHRRADLGRAEPWLSKSRTLSEYRIQGVWLARVVEVAGLGPPIPGEGRSN